LAARYVEYGFYGDPGRSPRIALFVSPHLDDAAFSCGGAMALLAEKGWYTVLATVFTRSMPDPTGFALECQLDKGLSAEVDYMALRREEDRLFAERAGVGAVAWLDLPEAPHRGYDSSSALFSGLLTGDDVWRRISEHLVRFLETWKPAVVFVPQALGAHADHIQVVRAVSSVLDPPGNVVWYRDTPYAARDPLVRASPLLPDDLAEMSVDVSFSLETKLYACAAYATQLGFQFGGEQHMRETLASFAAAEACRLDAPSTVAEALLVVPGSPVPK
jgi:LmbE family N-acetylglucosaminyl deacetylase